MVHSRCERGSNCETNRSASQARSIDANDLHQYCHYNGEDTMVIVLEATPTDELFGNEDALMMEKRVIRTKLACMLTNVGVVNLPLAVQQHVRQASFRIPSFGATMTVAVSTCGNTLTLNVTHPFESVAFSHALVETLTQLEIPTHLSDRGLEGYDILCRDAVLDLA